MDNYKSQQMQNWKKMMIMNPLLNNLFDSNLNVKDFIHDKILTLDHQQIVHTYSQLSSVKHAISKHIQKQVEINHNQIEKSFKSKHKISTQLKLENEKEIIQNVKKIQNFNQNYRNVQQNIIKLENINKIIKFSKSLQKFKINCRLLKTFMKDHNVQNLQKQEEQINRKSSFLINNQSLNLLKISKLIKQLNDLIAKNDFTGIKYYENQKQFINSSKAILYSVAQKQLNKTLLKYFQVIQDNIKSGTLYNKLTVTADDDKIKSLQEDIKDKFKILHSIHKLKDFISGFFKKNIKEVADILKNMFQTSTIQDFNNFFMNNVFTILVANARFFIRLEQILTSAMISKSLIGMGLPNLFSKYIQRLISYFNDLVKWNQDQDKKQQQKKKHSLKSIDSNQTLIINQIIEIKNAKQKQKHGITYKYPSLLNGLSILINRIHEEVLLYAQYNIENYQFTSRKQEMMNSLLPISEKFHQKFNLLINFKIHFNNSTQKQRSNSNSIINSEIAYKKLQCLECIYEKVIGININKKQHNQTDISQLSTLVEETNEDIILKLQELLGINDQNLSNKKDGQQSEANQGQQSSSHNSTSANFVPQPLKQFVKKLLLIVDNKKVLKCYGKIQYVINHLQRLKQIKALIQ